MRKKSCLYEICLYVSHLSVYSSSVFSEALCVLFEASLIQEFLSLCSFPFISSFCFNVFGLIFFWLNLIILRHLNYQNIR